MSTLKVDAIVDKDSGNTATINGQVISASNTQGKNLVINGAMNVAQRGTSSTTGGYKTVDRMSVGFAGTDEAPTITQADVASGTSPYTNGFRKSLKIQNGNQTSGAGAADEMALTYSFEAQDINTSGWDVSSTSSNVTLSFWVKSSVAQQFQVNVRLYGPSDANQREFAFEYTPTGADTWTKVTKTIPGHASNTIRADNASGMFIQFPTFYGTDYTNNARNFDTWEAKNNAQNYKDYVSTWYTTNDATWEITGLQLEGGASATEFEHRVFIDELRTCSRYFQTMGYNYGDTIGGTDNYNGALNGYKMGGEGSGYYGGWQFPVLMRATPTFVIYAVVSGSETAGKLIDFNSGSDLGSASVARLTANGWNYISSGSNSAGAVYRITAEAEL